ncbi:MAG TPA: hypothetical protein VJ995_00120 [Geothermobacteraceae bacterium]|nr:hypothetical protein [Geothermobacteraceae bacterium]
MLRKSLPLIIICLFLYSCAQQTALPTGFESQAERAGKLSPATNEQDGAVLYATHCASCHRSLEKSIKKDRTVSRIHSAIRHFSAMRNLDFLTIQQLRAISAVLKQP